MITYDLVALGYINGELYYKKIDNINSKKYTLKLDKGNLEEVKKLINNAYSSSIQKDFTQLLNYVEQNIIFEKHQASYKLIEKQREALKASISCASKFSW